MDVVQRVVTLGGAARTPELLAFGHSRRELSRAVADWQLTRVARGVYAAPGVDHTHLLAKLFGARVTCTSALKAYGVALVNRPQRVHLEVARGFALHGRSTTGVHLHFGRNSAPSGIAPVAQALAIASGCLSEREHLVAFDSALHSGLVTMQEVATWRSVAPPPVRRSGADAVASSVTSATKEGEGLPVSAVRFPSARREWLLAHADARAESLLETLARLDVAAAGLAVQPQRFVDGVGRVDLMVEGVLVVETDGKEHHDDPGAFQRDRDRNRKLQRKGFKVLRFTYRDIVGPDAVDVAEEVRAVLSTRTRRRTSR